MLQMGGTVKDVALSAFISGLAVTIGSIFWGKIIDTMHLRRTVIVISSASMAVLASLINLVSTIESLILISVILGFLTSGTGSVLNLLVMEKSRREEWIRTINWTSMFSCTGIVIAMMMGFLWLQEHNVKSYATLCAAISLASLVLAITFIKDRFPENSNAASLSRHRITPMAKQSKYVKLSFFASANTIQSLYKITIDKKLFFFVAVFLYFFSGNLFFTPYTPFLKDNGISDSEVFLAYSVLYLSQTIILPFSHRMIASSEEKIGRLSYLPRMLGIVLVLATALLLSGSPSSVMVVTLIAFVLVDAAFSMWNTTIASSLMKMVQNGKSGTLMGVNSSITSAGLLVGSIVSGQVTASSGYSTTFLLAFVTLAASFVMLSCSSRQKSIFTVYTGRM